MEESYTVLVIAGIVAIALVSALVLMLLAYAVHRTYEGARDWFASGKWRRDLWK